MDTKSSRPASSPARGLVAISAAALAFAVTAFAPQVLNDGDTFLHVAAGSRMVSDHAILFRDPFSLSFVGARWEAHEWLAEIVMALCYRAGNWGGLLLLFAFAAAAAAGTLSYALGRRLEPMAQALATVLALSCMTGSLLARPHLLALPLLTLWTAGLAKARDEGRAPSLVLLPLMMVWVNVHGSFLLGLALAAGFALETAIEDRGRGAGMVRDWAIFGAGALAATLINPHGIDGALFPLRLMSTPALANVAEWQATPISLLQPIFPIGAFVAYLIATRRVRVPAVRAAMLLVLAYMAFTHVRHQIVFAAVAPLLLAAPIAQALGQRRAEPVARWPAATAAALALAALTGLRLALPVARGDAPTAPVTALAHVPSAIRGKPVLNDYSFGGYLIFAGVRPFIDSRVELYGEAMLDRYAALLRHDPGALDDTLRRYGIRWAILSPSSPIAGELNAMPGWRRTYSDRFAVVQIRDR